MSVNELPPEINVNTAAWYMKEHMGLSYTEIGLRLSYTPQGVHKIVENTFERKSPAVIYRLQQEYCKQDCIDSVSECRSCNLYKFMLKKMVKK